MHQIVHDILRHEARTLLQYACEAGPRFSAGDVAALDRLQSLANAEMAASRSLAAWLKQHREIAPGPDPYPESFMRLNFASLPYVLRMLEKDTRETIARLHGVLPELRDSGVRRLVEHLVEAKENSLRAFQNWSTASTAPVAAAH